MITAPLAAAYAPGPTYGWRGFALLQIPGRSGTHWIVAFLTHWSILFEAAIWIAAFTMWRHRRPQ